MVTATARIDPARPEISALIDVLGGGDITRLVGGAVRDALLGLPASDVDLATRLLPDMVIARLEAADIKAVPTGLAHGTVTAVIADGPVEVTTLRRDVATDGRHAEVAFSDDWRDDAARRDFTINALYADGATGAVIDYFDGLADLAARRVRFIGEPVARIAEDHLRILRFFRFHARFGGGAPDEAALVACTARANDLMALSRERIAAELLKLLAVADPAPTIATMIAHGILRPVLPEFTDAAALARLVARERAAGLAGDPLRRLAALVGAGDATDIAARLKLAKAQAKRLVLATACDPASLEALAYRHGTVAAIDRLLLGEDDVRDVHMLDHWRKPTLGISGGDLIARGVPVGPAVAQTLQTIERAWIAAGFPDGERRDEIVSGAIRRAI